MRGLLLSAILAIGACAAGGAVQRGINLYQVGNYPDAMAAWLEVEPETASLRDKTLARYLVYRGLTQHRLGHRAGALHFLTLGRQAYLVGNPRWLRPEVVAEMTAALSTLTGSGPTAPPSPHGPVTPTPPLPPGPPPPGAENTP
jgi:hypothetical protein